MQNMGRLLTLSNSFEDNVRTIYPYLWNEIDVWVRVRYDDIGMSVNVVEWTAIKTYLRRCSPLKGFPSPTSTNFFPAINLRVRVINVEWRTHFIKVITENYRRRLIQGTSWSPIQTPCMFCLPAWEVLPLCGQGVSWAVSATACRRPITHPTIPLVCCAGDKCCWHTFLTRRFA